MARPRQTLNYLRNLFARRGIAPQRQFGQNFLIDLNIHDLIVNTAELGPDDVVLEVGPGAGAMTALMAEQAGAVVAVDLDPAMAELAAEAVAEMPNARVLHLDALAGKNRLNPEMLDHVQSGLAAAPGRRFKLVANLPYNIATPLIVNLLVHPEPAPVPERLVVTIQLELAQRLIAEPSTPDYGSLSVIVQALADAEIVRTLGPRVFWPMPKVESAVVKITPNAAKREALPDLNWFHTVVRRIFLHRRKNLRGVLHAAWRGYWTKPEIDAMLGTLGIEGGIRAEAMNVEELIDLSEAMKSRLPETLWSPRTGRPDEADRDDGDDGADRDDDDDRED